MIARVRIAPVEKWCEAAKAACGHDLAGREVGILTETFEKIGTSVPKCGGSDWLVERNFVVERCIELGIPIDNSFALCEHMLEMD